MTSLRVSVIIPFHQNLGQLAQSLSAARRSMPAADILIAADGAREDCRPLAEAHRARVIEVAGPSGPAVARNRAAAQATGDVLVFVDTDVVVAPDALPGLCAVLEAEPDVAAVFGAYDLEPPEPNFMSQYKNLSHACVHETGNAEAATFWAGLGAIRTSVFGKVGGFDESFRRPSVEDIDLGYRVRQAGYRLRLDPRWRGRHLKHWTMWTSIVTDVRARGIPWTRLIHKFGALTNDLNTRHELRWSVVLSYLLVAALAAAVVRPWAGVVAAAALAALIVLNRGYYAWFLRHRGAWFTVRVVPAHVVYHLCNGVSFAAGTSLHWVDRQRLALIAILLFTAALGGRGITDEASVMLGNDMARYVMNGVFVHDWIAAGGTWTFADLLHFAERYYARYPALSLGHHPPLPYVSIVPFYAVFGVSLVAARLAATTWFILAAWGVYALGRRLFDWKAGAWATLLFVTIPFVLRPGQYLLSEMPMTALVLASLNALFRYCDRGHLRDYVWFILIAAMSFYAKQLAVFMAPVHALILVLRSGWRNIARRSVLMATAAGALLLVPLAVMTLKLSPANVAIAAWNVTRLAGGNRGKTVWEILADIIHAHMSPPLLAIVTIGVIVLMVRRTWRTALILTWIASVWAGCVVFAAGVEPARYAFGAIPAYCLAAASLATGWTRVSARRFAVAALGALVLWQVWTIRNVRPSGAGGYEEAAEYVLQNNSGPTVLYDSSVDTGYFMFFVRKHDANRGLIVLRADQLLTTPAVDERGPGSRVDHPGQIEPLLQTYGTRYVVVEERTAGPLALRLLHDDLKTAAFVERRRIPIRTREPEAKGKSLVVYEFLHARPPDLDAELDIPIPVANREIKLRLGDLVGGRKR